MRIHKTLMERYGRIIFMEFVIFILVLIFSWVIAGNIVHATGLSIFLFATYHLAFVVGIGFGWIMLIYLIVGTALAAVFDF